MTADTRRQSHSIDLTISVPGTFWAFKIADAITARGGAVDIYTSEPNWRRTEDVPAARVHQIRLPFYIAQIGHQLPVVNRLFGVTGYNRPFQRWGDYYFDWSVARQLKAGGAEQSLFLGFAGACREALRRANELGYTTVVERSSTHIRTQREILEEEYARHGAAGQPISLAHVEREEAEYDLADYIVTPSAFTVDSFRSQGVSEEKLVRIPFGADPVPSADRDQSGPVRFLYAGHVSLRKGIQYLLPAWDRAAVSDAELVVAGNVGDAVTDLVAAYEDDDSIRFEGWVEDMESLYETASALVLPTLEEGSARVTYEAMARGLPVVTTPHSGWVGTDGEHGIEVPIRDTAALSDAIELLCSNASLRNRLGSSGRTLIESRYTWEDYEDRIWNTYSEMVDRGD